MMNMIWKFIVLSKINRVWFVSIQKNVNMWISLRLLCFRVKTLLKVRKKFNSLTKKGINLLEKLKIIKERENSKFKDLTKQKFSTKIIFNITQMSLREVKSSFSSFKSKSYSYEGSFQILLIFLDEMRTLHRSCLSSNQQIYEFNTTLSLKNWLLCSSKFQRWFFKSLLIALSKLG